MERALAIYLRVTAVVLMLALPAVLMPHAWMDAVHRWRGMGELPELPVVSYLARSTSALYVVSGATYWFVGGDVRRYLPFLRFAVWMSFALAGLLLAADVLAGMPWDWTVGEVGFTIAWSCGLWWLVGQVKAP